MASMPRKLPLYAYRERTRHGKTVFFFRVGHGKRTRIKGEPGTKEFQSSYIAAYEGHFNAKPVKSKAGSIGWLIGEYLKSGAFQDYAPTTRKNRETMLLKIASENPNAPAHLVTRAHITQGMDKRSPVMGNHFLKVMRGLFNWACNLEYLEKNPCEGVKKRSTPKTKRHTWTEEECDKYRETFASGTTERLAFEIMRCAGMALADACTLCWNHIEGDMIEKPRQKTGVIQHVAIDPPLSIELAIAKSSRQGTVILLTQHGKPFTAAGIGNWFRDKRTKAGLPPQCEAHGLRRAKAVELAESGVTVLEMMPIMGWETTEEAELYTRSADKKRLAMAGAKRTKNKQKIPHLPSKSRTQK